MRRLGAGDSRGCVVPVLGASRAVYFFRCEGADRCLKRAVLTSTSGVRIGKPGDPCVMVIFGAAGDLTRRKLIPALYNLASEQLLSREFAIIGVARAPMTTEEFREKVSKDIKEYATGPVDSDLWEWFVRRMYYITGDFNDAGTYAQLSEALKKADKDHSTHGNYFFYSPRHPLTSPASFNNSEPAD